LLMNRDDDAGTTDGQSIPQQTASIDQHRLIHPERAP
jgi:hypothetical protein